MTTRRKIDLLIESPHIAFWRICGKESQKKYRRLNRKDSAVDRNNLIKEIVVLYIDRLYAMPTVHSKERMAKIRCINYFANKESN